MSGLRQASTWMLIAALSAASQAACVRVIRDSVDWRIITLSRAVIGLLIALVILRIRRVPFPMRPPPQLWLRTGAGALAFLCSFYAAARIPVADALVLLNTSPIWIMILSMVVLGQRPRVRTIIILVATTAGVIVIAQPHFAQRNLGALAAITTAALMAVAYLAVGRMRAVNPMAIIAHATAGVVVSSGIAVLASADSLSLDFISRPDIDVLLVAVAIFGTMAQIGVTRAYATAGGARVASLQYTTVAFGALFDYVLFGHTLTATSLIGIALVVGPALWLVLLAPPPGELRGRKLEIDITGWGDLGRLRELEAVIRAAELRTSCEVRVHVDRHCADPQRTPREVFQKLGMERTRLRTGVLVYLALESRHFALVVDDGVADELRTSEIDRMCDAITADMHAHDPVVAVGEGIEKLFTRLGRSFPPQADDANELPDEILIRSGDVIDSSVCWLSP